MASREAALMDLDGVTGDACTTRMIGLDWDGVTSDAFTTRMIGLDLSKAFRQEHRARTVVISSYQTWQEQKHSDPGGQLERDFLPRMQPSFMMYSTRTGRGPW